MTQIYSNLWHNDMAMRMHNPASHVVASTRFAITMKKQCGRKDRGEGP